MFILILYVFLYIHINIYLKWNNICEEEAHAWIRIVLPALPLFSFCSLLLFLSVKVLIQKLPPKFHTLNDLNCEQRERMGLQWPEGWGQSLPIWIRTWIYWNVQGIWTLKNWIFCGWTFLCQLLSKWLQVFKFIFLHQTNAMASLLNDRVPPHLELISVHCMEFKADVNVLRGWVGSLQSLEC